MAYTPKTWVCGEVITAEDMNHIEEGIAENCGSCDSPLLLTATLDEDSGIYTFDQTWKEVKDALVAGRRVLWAEGEDMVAKTEPYYCVKVDAQGSTLVAYLIEWVMESDTATATYKLLTANNPNDNLKYMALE